MPGAHPGEADVTRRMWGPVVLKTSPGDSHVQPGLRTTGPRAAAGRMTREVRMSGRYFTRQEAGMPKFWDELG